MGEPPEHTHEGDMVREAQPICGGPAAGRSLVGRPRGRWHRRSGVSRLDGKEDEIRRFLELGVSKTAIAKITGVSRTALYSFMSTRRPPSWRRHLVAKYTTRLVGN